MILLALLAVAPMPAQETLGFERMLLCDAYREIWQWDEHNAGRKVPEDNDWYGPFRDRLRAAGAAQGLDRYKISALYNAKVQSLRPSRPRRAAITRFSRTLRLGNTPRPSGT